MPTRMESSANVSNQKVSWQSLDREGQVTQSYSGQVHYFEKGTKDTDKQRDEAQPQTSQTLEEPMLVTLTDGAIEQPTMTHKFLPEDSEQPRTTSPPIKFTAV